MRVASSLVGRRVFLLRVMPRISRHPFAGQGMNSGCATSSNLCNGSSPQLPGPPVNIPITYEEETRPRGG